MAPLPSVLIVTRIPFWRLGAGERMRLLALVWALGPRTRLTVLYLGQVAAAEVERIKALRLSCGIQTLAGPADAGAETAALRRLTASVRFDVCILERIQLHFLLDAIPAGVRTVLDTHDLESANAESRRRVGAEPAGSMSTDEEMACLAAYDRVLLIQADDYAQVRGVIGERAMLVPHPVVFPARPLSPGTKRLGFVASAWAANLDGLDWFADQVRPRLDSPGHSIHLFGWIGDHWRPGSDGFVRHGFLADFDRVWGAIDVAFNPVRWGSGLKIKNVEALGNGLPLVTTREGARGLLDGAGTAFLLAETPEAFAEAGSMLLEEPERRRLLGAAAYDFAQTRFSAAACFGELLRWIAA